MHPSKSFIRSIRTLIVVILCAIAPSGALAQGNRVMKVQIKVVKEMDDVKDSVGNNLLLSVGPGCELYVFNNKAKGQKLFNKLAQNAGAVIDLDIDKSEYDSRYITDNDGFCDLLTNSNDYFFTYQRGIGMSKQVYGINGRDIIQTILESKVIQLSDTLARTYARAKRTLKIRDITVGDTKIVTATVPIDQKDADPKCRYGLAPYTTAVTASNEGFTSATQSKNLGDSIFKVIRPYIIDGTEYRKTQYRKMGFDFSNDSLERFVDKTQFIARMGGSDSIQFNIYEVLKPVKDNCRYPTQAYSWIEGYNSIAKEDTITISDGFSVRPMRWLEFNVPDIDIDKVKFERHLDSEPQDGAEAVNLIFKVNSAQIDETDSIGRLTLDNIIEGLRKIEEDPAGRLFNVQIHGTASPEGGKSRNQALGNLRAQYVSSYVGSKLHIRPDAATSEIIPWTVIADSIEADSAFDIRNIERAQQIRRICSAVPFEQQEAQIKNLPFWAMVHDHYLPRFRKVFIKYQYTVTRPLSPEEVCYRYENEPDFRAGKNKIYPYMYYYLFDYLRDRPRELERIALMAYNDHECYEQTGKPWTLAAYHLANCYAERDLNDITLLAPYIRVDGKTKLNHDERNLDGYHVEYLNDEGVVMAQINQLVKANKIFDAFYLSDNLFPDVYPYSKVKTFLDCMAQGWNIPEVRDTIAASSPWNKVVVYAAQDGNDALDKASWENALDELRDTVTFSRNDPRVLYMIGTLRHRLEAQNYKSRKDGKAYPDEVFEPSEADKEDPVTLILPDDADNDGFSAFGYPMIRCCELDPTFIDILKLDGEFNQNYRDGFAHYWNQIHPDMILK